MKNLSHFDEKSQSFWPSQVGRYDNVMFLFSVLESQSRSVFVPMICTSTISVFVDLLYIITLLCSLLCHIYNYCLPWALLFVCVYIRFRLLPAILGAVLVEYRLS